uniref:Uncharacterized protein n=1 Tax=Lactuca sativa TaxID=4236 RepID=A0A9R1XX70_LACSA|nr:hypothetical protein LSAT_V11C100039030 [Lactuca sativa]
MAVIRSYKLPNITDLTVSSAKNEVNFGVKLGSLKQVLFFNCGKLENYNCPNSVENLVIRDYDSLTSLTFSAVHEHLFGLTSLEIRFCKNLKLFPHEYFQSLTSLEELEIHDCPSIDYSFPCGLWPTNIRKLTIGCLKKPMPEWGPQNFPARLLELYLHGKNSGVVSFAVADDVGNTTTTPSSSSSFLLPPSLVSLTLWKFTDVESFSEVLQHLPCLKRLDILSCPKIRDLNTTFDPSNLTIRVV